MCLIVYALTDAVFCFQQITFHLTLTCVLNSENQRWSFIWQEWILEFSLRIPSTMMITAFACGLLPETDSRIPRNQPETVVKFAGSERLEADASFLFEVGWLALLFFFLLHAIKNLLRAWRAGILQHKHMNRLHALTWVVSHPRLIKQLNFR